MWWMSGVGDVLFYTQCGGCLVWWMSGMVDVWCGGCPVWWMSGVVDVWCGGCPILPMVWWMSDVVDVWCGGCPFLAMVWWMSGVVDVCVVDVVQSAHNCQFEDPFENLRRVNLNQEIIAALTEQQCHSSYLSPTSLKLE